MCSWLVDVAFSEKRLFRCEVNRCCLHVARRSHCDPSPGCIESRKKVRKRSTNGHGIDLNIGERRDEIIAVPAERLTLGTAGWGLCRNSDPD